MSNFKRLLVSVNCEESLASAYILKAKIQVQISLKYLCLIALNEKVCDLNHLLMMVYERNCCTTQFEVIFI